MKSAVFYSLSHLQYAKYILSIIKFCQILNSINKLKLLKLPCKRLFSSQHDLSLIQDSSSKGVFYVLQLHAYLYYNTFIYIYIYIYITVHKVVFCLLYSFCMSELFIYV
jgi:hypothetical protein